MFGFQKIAKPTANHGKRLVAMKYKVEKTEVMFPATRKKAAKKGPAFKITCAGFHEDEVDASSRESLLATVKEVITGNKLFTYNTKFIVSPLAAPLTGLAATRLLDNLNAGLSCLIAYSEDGLAREGTSSPKPEADFDILKQLGISPDDLGIGPEIDTDL